MTSHADPAPLLTAGAVALAGLSIPVLPRIFVPLSRPGRYVDGLDALAAEPLLILWTAAPFLALALLALVLVGRARKDPPRRRRTIQRVLTSALGTAPLGWWMHVPQTEYGMNFGPVAFPFLAVPTMVLLYGIATILTPKRPEASPPDAPELQ